MTKKCYPVVERVFPNYLHQLPKTFHIFSPFYPSWRRLSAQEVVPTPLVLNLVQNYAPSPSPTLIIPGHLSPNVPSSFPPNTWCNSTRANPSTAEQLTPTRSALGMHLFFSGTPRIQGGSYQTKQPDCRHNEPYNSMRSSRGLDIPANFTPRTAGSPLPGSC